MLDIYKFNRRKPEGLFDTLDKGIIRQEILALRKGMPEADVADFSRIISNALISLDVFKNASTIAIYAPFRNEVDLSSVLKSRTKRFVFPKVLKGTKKLGFYEVGSVDELIAGKYGIMEPAADLKKIEIEEIDLFAVPGVAFSENCERIGYGGGFYDETLRHKNDSSVAAGIAFDLQIVPGGFSDQNDMNMNMVITEKRLFNNTTTT